MKLKIYQKSDIGSIRTSNQDCCNSGYLKDEKIFAIVCDGMGGAKRGDIASNLSVAMITEELIRCTAEDLDDNNIKNLLLNIVQRTNEVVFEKSKSQEDFNGMGTTIIVAIVSDKKIQLVHVGDSRAYIIHNKRIKQLTTDHSIVQEMINAGEITLAEARNHPRKNIITRALGIGENLEIDFIESDFYNNDYLLICTDGLSNELQEADILNVFQNQPDNIAESLVDAANNMGGSDNITALVIKNN